MKLTKRQAQVYASAVDGPNTKEITRILNLSINGVKYYLNCIFVAAEVTSMQKLVVLHYKTMPAFLITNQGEQNGKTCIAA
jgi:DNA-binding NarL/FixJ family response regulator